MKKRFTHIVLVFFVVGLGIKQVNGQTASSILTKSQEHYKTSEYTMDIHYKMFGDYASTESLEDYKAQLIKNNTLMYYKVYQTIYVYDAGTKQGLKLEEAAKTIEVANDSESQINDSLLDIGKFLNHFKDQKVTEIGDTYICTLTTGGITQLPYGKVEIHVNKTDFTITKQVLYFLTKYPYKTTSGELKKGYPRMEIDIANFSNSISPENRERTAFNTYVTKNNGDYKPNNAYKNFTIIKK